MKMFMKKKLALFLTVLLLVPFIWNQNDKVASAAATPSFSKTKVSITGIGENYQMVIKNKVAKSTYKWTTSDSKIAKVTSKGLITTVSGGTATIKCKITYPSKKTKSLSCKVTITVPATAIEIKHDALTNNAYKLELGSSVTFVSVMTPANTTDKAYWYIDQDNVLSDPSCISLSDPAKGTITAVKAGKAVLRVRAAKELTQAAATASTIDSTIIIEVAAPSATVSSAEITTSNQITVLFDSPVQKNTVINADGTLSSNITISLCKVNKITASDPGKLTPILSTDGKTLTITSANSFEGTYGINFNKSILTTSGVALDEYYKQVTYSDTIAPYIVNTTYDDSGMIATINFNETIDFTNFSVKNATVVTAAASATTNTLSVLGNTGNYIISTDKRSVSINMATISATDYGKLFSVMISGIKDLGGNAPTSSTLPAYLQTDTTPKPQAQLLNITRSSYNTLTATFDKSIKSGGNIMINGGASITGVVSPSNTREVIYTMSSVEAQYTGVKPVAIGLWSGYNVIASDLTAMQYYTRSVDFTVEKINPVAIASEFDAATSILTLTYSELVNIPASNGVFLANLKTIYDDVVPGINISYIVVSHTLGNNIVKLKLTFSSPKTGYYSFTMPQGFAVDSFGNVSVSKEMIINNSTGSTELPAPYRIAQTSSNLSEITLQFSNKLDLTSATTISNYAIPGVIIQSIRVDGNTPETGATVILTVQTIDATADRPITINGVKGYNNTYTAISNYSTSVYLKENIKPYVSGTPVYDSNKKNVINLNFNEQIQGTLTVVVTQVYANTSVVLSNQMTVNGNSAIITLGSIPTNGTYLKIDIVTNNITDISGNQANFTTTTYGVMATY